MNDDPTRPVRTPREERLAARLRDNLRRRKQQARGLATETSLGETPLTEGSDAAPADPPLPKPAPGS